MVASTRLAVLPAPDGAALAKLGPHTQRLLRALERGESSGVLPPVKGVGPDRTLLALPFGGKQLVASLAAALAKEPFSRWGDCVERSGAWCATARERWGKLVTPSLLDVTNDALFGPFLAEAFSLCLSSALRGQLESAAPAFLETMELFFSRLEHDLRRGPLRRAGFVGPVAELIAQPDETHNGKQRVLAVRWGDGRRLAYKARPASSEALFLRRGHSRTAASVFELLNRLPPAAGSIDLPTLEVHEGRATDGSVYSWQEWIEPSTRFSIIRRQGKHRLEATRLSRAETREFWRSAGQLAAAAAAFGASDLHESNVIVGASRRAPQRAQFYAVDFECVDARKTGLLRTGLIADEDESGNHHVGFERTPRFCSAGGSVICFTREPSGTLAVEIPRRTWARAESRSLVVDERGNAGYAEHLLPFLRGMFDCAVHLLSHQERIRRFLQRNAQGRHLRVLLRNTADYTLELDDRLSSVRSRRRWKREELEQLDRGDAPYFFRSAMGGPLLCQEHTRSGWRTRTVRGSSWHAPLGEILSGERFALVNLASALQDTVAYVYSQLPSGQLEDRALGVRLDAPSAQQGRAWFDWKEMGIRVWLSWSRGRISSGVEP